MSADEGHTRTSRSCRPARPRGGRGGGRARPRPRRDRREHPRDGNRDSPRGRRVARATGSGSPVVPELVSPARRDERTRTNLGLQAIASALEDADEAGIPAERAMVIGSRRAAVSEASSSHETRVATAASPRSAAGSSANRSIPTTISRPTASPRARRTKARRSKAPTATSRGPRVSGL